MNDYDLDAMVRDGIDPCDRPLADEDETEEPTPHSIDLMHARMSLEEWTDFCAECAEEDEAERIHRQRESEEYTAEVMKTSATGIPIDPSIPF